MLLILAKYFVLAVIPILVAFHHISYSPVLYGLFLIITIIIFPLLIIFLSKEIQLDILFSNQAIMALILIPFLISEIGDGFAEVFGIRFGRHKYQVRALFTNRRYVRSIEGSMCVFITGIVVIAAHAACFTPVQFIVALGVIPVIMAVT